MPDHEPHLAITAGIDETVRQTRGVRPGDHLDVCGVDRQLCQCVVEHGHVIGRRARAGVAGT